MTVRLCPELIPGARKEEKPPRSPCSSAVGAGASGLRFRNRSPEVGGADILGTVIGQRIGAAAGILGALSAWCVPARAAGISGAIHYYSDGAPVSGVTVHSEGASSASVQTDGTGSYAFTDLAPGAWYVTPHKQGSVTGTINAVDAVFALQAAVGLRALNERQRLACDVSGNGGVNAVDAVLMLQYAVGLITSFPVGQRCASDWAFVAEPGVGGAQVVAPDPGATPCVRGAMAFQSLGGQAVDQNFAAVLFGDCNGSWPPAPPPVPLPTPTAGPAERLDVLVVGVAPHDSQAFTQGLLLHDGVLYESTGLYNSSSVRAVDPASGNVSRQIALAGTYFGEGLARVGDRLIQLTWQEHTAFVYDLATFGSLGEFAYTTEGWGLCYDGTRLVMSDGSNTLFFRDPTTFAVIGKVAVMLDGSPLPNLNELECVGRTVYANVWSTDTIARIDPDTGVVTGMIDASGLLTSAERANAEVLNGIAYHPTNGTFLLTGKFWPKLFEVRFVPSN